MVPTPRHVPELLAPAGDWPALRAAVAAGADAVYFGLESFNARRRAANFTRAALPHVVRWLHERNVRGYVALNTLVYSDELPPAAEYLRAIAESGADAVIIQDLGVMQLARRLAPTLPVHASTQTTQTDAGGLALLAELGVRRVILARELSLAEIRQVAAATPLELEVFIHGALCISYSGQCLASETFFGRSGNRGECAQACRLPYGLVVDGRPHACDRPYPLSPSDLAAWDRIPQLAALGIAGLKIEGRLKRPAYVAAVTATYRAALDALARGARFELSRSEPDAPAKDRLVSRVALEQGFARGFTPGFLDGIDHQQLVPGRSPKPRGSPVGTVAGHARGGVVIRLDEHAVDPKPGDGLLFEPPEPGRPEQGGRVYEVAPDRSRDRQERGAGRHVRLMFGRDDLDPAAVLAGSRVWKTDDPAVRRELERVGRRDVRVRRVPLDVRAQATAGRPLRVELRDHAGHVAAAESDRPLEPATRHPLTVDSLREQFARLGETPFELGTVELEGREPGTPADAVMAPKSVLNELRRRCVANLLEQRAAAARHAIADPHALETLRGEMVGPWRLGLGSDRRASATGGRRYAVLVRTAGQLEAVLAWHAQRPPAAAAAATVEVPCSPDIYCDFAKPGDERALVERIHAAGRLSVLAAPRITHPADTGLLRALAEARPDAVLVRNLAALHFFRSHAPSLPLIADAGLNVANELAAAALLRLGVAVWTPAQELSWAQVRMMLSRIPAATCEIVAHQRVPLFHTRHCLYAAALSDGPRCGACGWPCRGHTLALRDRRGQDHPVVPDATGCNTVFAARPRSLAVPVSEVFAAGVTRLRIELLDESPEAVIELLGRYAAALAKG